MKNITFTRRVIRVEEVLEYVELDLEEVTKEIPLAVSRGNWS